MQDLKNRILKDIKVEMTDEFDMNFKRGAFFSKPWPAKRDGSASHLILTGKLRRSIMSRIVGSSVVFTSSEDYAAIHNYGGTITVTAKMKAFFWAKYKETGQERYKRMALMKVGSKITIPQRQFLGDAPEVKKAVNEIIKDNIEKFAKEIASNAQRKSK